MALHIVSNQFPQWSFSCYLNVHIAQSQPWDLASNNSLQPAPEILKPKKKKKAAFKGGQVTCFAIERVQPFMGLPGTRVEKPHKEAEEKLRVEKSNYFNILRTRLY